jgi:hypothetical protein
MESTLATFLRSERIERRSVVHAIAVAEWGAGAAILLVAAGWAPRWSGLVYGGTFGTILLVAASLDLMGSRLATVSSERVLASVRAIARPVRWASAALALVAALAALPPTWLP